MWDPYPGLNRIVGLPLPPLEGEGLEGGVVRTGNEMYPHPNPPHLWGGGNRPDGRPIRLPAGNRSHRRWSVAHSLQDKVSDKVYCSCRSTDMETLSENDYSGEVDVGGSADSTSVRVVQLGIADIPAILDLEIACWSPAIRANEATLITRFELGHISLGLFDKDKLIGTTSFSYWQCGDPTLARLPKTFKEFSSHPRHEQPDSAYVYNFNMHPDYRGTAMTRQLIFTGVSRLIEDGCSNMFGAVRCPSYNGSQTSFEHIEQSPRFRRTIDHNLLNGTTPSTKEFIADPLLRFYHRVLGCKFLAVVPGFLEGDESSGGLGVIFHKPLGRGA